MYPLVFSLTFLALATGKLASPTPQGFYGGFNGFQGFNGLGVTSLQCSDPSQGTGTTTINKIDLDNRIFSLDSDKTFCVTGTGKVDVQSEWTLVEGCGTNNAAIWLQSFENEKFCLTGRQIKVFAELISASCVDITNGQVYGSAQLDSHQHWVLVGKSNSCDLSSSDQK